MRDGPAVLDHEPALGDTDHERAVVQVERAAVLEAGVDGLQMRPLRRTNQPPAPRGSQYSSTPAAVHIRHASLRWPAATSTR